MSLKEVISAIPHLEGSTRPKVKAVHGQATPVCYNRVKKASEQENLTELSFLFVGWSVGCLFCRGENQQS